MAFGRRRPDQHLPAPLEHGEGAGYDQQRKDEDDDQEAASTHEMAP
jgi:hypothetical protein